MWELSFFVIFNIVVLLSITADFMILSVNSSAKCALTLTGIWILAGISFSVVIYFIYGLNETYEYLTAYIVEKSMSIDNMFVFFMIFSEFCVERKHQHKLLFIGIWSAMILRTIMIFAVGQLLDVCHAVMYIFGGMILYAGIRSFCASSNNSNTNSLIAAIKRHIPMFSANHNGHLFIREQGRLKMTILLIVITVIEISDIVFAFDSIPALFSITTNKLIIYTSNILAIIGLRSLYISFATAVDRFCYLRYAVGVILCLIGLKMLCADYISIDSGTCLIFICCILFVSAVASNIKQRSR